MGVALPMPWCHDSRRSAPNVLLRSSLFGTFAKKDRQQINNKVIYCSNGIEIKYSGEQLDQDDLEIWLEVVNLASYPGGCNQFCIADKILFSSNGFLRRIGKSGGSCNTNNLINSLERLKENSIRINTQEKKYLGSLIDSVYRNERKQLVVRFNPELANLFFSYTQLYRDERHKLRGKQLCLWLHAFYCTHENSEFRYAAKTIKKMCGSNSGANITGKNDRSFLRELRNALAFIEETLGWKCYLDEKNQVFVRKPKRVAMNSKIAIKQINNDDPF